MNLAETIRTTVVVHGFDWGLDLDFKSFLRTGFLIGLEGKIWISFKSNFLDLILDFFQPLPVLWVSILVCQAENSQMKSEAPNGRQKFTNEVGILISVVLHIISLSVPRNVEKSKFCCQSLKTVWAFQS